MVRDHRRVVRPQRNITHASAHQWLHVGRQGDQAERCSGVRLVFGVRESSGDKSHSTDICLVRRQLELIDERLAMIGKTISHYRILEKLGEGGMGVVYKAEDTKLKRTVALKFLPTGLEANEPERARLLQEAQAASALNHPNICAIHTLGEHKGQQFIDMEFVDGVTLRQKIRADGGDGPSPLRIDDIIAYAIQIGEALQEAHSHDIVHRDIKTANIMVNTKDQVKVMDFGLAKLKGSLKLTKTSSTIGTLAYMSPEQIQGKEVDPRSDIFSFGIVLFEMLAGRTPFSGEHEAAMMYSILNEEPESVLKYRPELSSEFIHILNRALEKEPQERYQSIQEMLIDLRRAKKESTKVSRRSLADIPALPEERKAPEEVLKTPPPPVRATSHKRLILGVSAILIVSIVVASLFIFKKQPTKPALATHRQITFTGKVGLTSISPDGNFVAYTSQVSPTETKMFVQDLTGGQPLEIFEAKYSRSFDEIRWSPDGSEILISAWSDSAAGTYIVPRLGGTPRKMLDLNWACWSPDGRHLALNRAMSKKRIWFTNKITGDTTSISLKGNFEWLYEVDWSSAGNLLLYRTKGQKRHTIWTITTDGSQQSEVVEDSVRLFSPRFSSKGDAIYYLRSQGQTKDLMKVKIDATSGKTKSSPVVIYNGLQVGDFFSITKDNRRLFYTREQRYSNLWSASYETGQIKIKQLTEGSSNVFDPSISPNGEKIAFSMGNSLEANVFVMPIEGGKMEQLTFFNSYNDGPVWSPDGKEIAFGSRQGGVPHVWTVNSNGGSPRPFRKSELSGDTFVLAWAPCSQILYQRPGNRNYHFLDPETEVERPLVRNDSVGWMFDPVYSPDCKKIVVFWNRRIPPKPGVWLISLVDSSQICLESGRFFALPLGWSSDCNWVYAGKTLGSETEIVMLPAEGNKPKRLITLPLPFERIGISMHPNGKRFAYVLSEAQSDAWLMENFDPEVK